jgi:trehalose 6-phosphate synthase
MKASGSRNNSRLEELCLSRLADRRLILASNRGPVEYFVDEKDELRPRRGSGGVVTALEGLSQYVRLNWIASAMREGDRKAVELAQGGSFSGPDNENLRLRFIVNARSTYHKYYSVFSNPLLWFLQHYMWNLSRTPNIDRVIYDAWQDGYVPVNQAFAQAVIDEAAASELPPVVIINDYHLYLVSDYIKRQLPELPIQHFIHIP